jgi:hypothetical protein
MQPANREIFAHTQQKFQNLAIVSPGFAQCTTMSLGFLSFASFKPSSEWTRDDVDGIMTSSNKIHGIVLDRLKWSGHPSTGFLRASDLQTIAEDYEIMKSSK